MPTQNSKEAADLSEQAMRLAEQLGRMAGTVEGTAEAWLNRQTLAEQLTHVRDSAAQMLESLGVGALKERTAQPAKKAVPTRKAADPAHAPGKRRRKPAPSLRGVKKSNPKISKMRPAGTVRQRRKSFA